MAVITSIEPQKSKKRINIFLDGKFGFGLDLENFIKLGIKVGQELTGENIALVTKKAEYQKILDRLLVFATLRPRSSKEVRDWMNRKKVNSVFVGDLIDKLRGLDLLDDIKFAQWWVEQRIAYKSKSARELIFELKNKGIEKNIIDEVLERLFDKNNESNSAKLLIEKNMYKWSKLSKKISRQKIKLFLLRKGFKWETIRNAVDLTIGKD